MHLHLRSILLGRKHLFEQGPELRFAKHPACLDIGEEMLEIAYPLCQGLHLAQSLVNHFETFGHLPETLSQPLLQRGMQLLVHRLPHLIELAGIALLQLGHLRFQREAHFLQAACVGFGQ